VHLLYLELYYGGGQEIKMSITIKLKDKKWLLEIKDEAWAFESLEEMELELKHCLSMKDNFGRLIKNEY